MTEWIDWNGGENPVPGKEINVRFRDGIEDHLPEDSGIWTWAHEGHAGDIIAYRVVEEEQRIETPMTKIKSDGSATSYYDLPEGCKTLNDLIEYKDMNFARGNIFKAAYRLGEKDGAETVYDLKKIIYFAERMLKIEEGKQNG